MSARIVNHLDLGAEGTLYPSEAEARSALAAMVKRFKKKGHVVTATENLDGDNETWHNVADATGQLIGIYYVTLN